MKKHALTAVALSAALALSTAPAFATDGAASSGTTVSIETTANNIVAEVPVALTFAADAAGGALTGPSEGAYYIANKSTIPIKVTKVEAALADGNGGQWSLAAASGTITDAPTGTVGDLNLKLTPDKLTAVDIYKDNTVKDGLSWAINGGSADTPTKLTIAVAGNSSKLASTTSTPQPAVKLTYTVEAAPKTA